MAAAVGKDWRKRKDGIWAPRMPTHPGFRLNGGSWSRQGDRTEDKKASFFLPPRRPSNPVKHITTGDDGGTYHADAELDTSASAEG